MLCQSIFCCRQQYDIVKLIRLQADTNVFFSSFLELEKSNLISVLSFDSKSIRALLAHDSGPQFSSEYPLFYQTRYDSLDYIMPGVNACCKRSAIDIALENHQVRALNLMIKYIIEYQNSYVYSFLFEKNFMKIMQMGIPVTDLIQSSIFCYQFDFQEWPSIHLSSQNLIKPYNGSMFKLR